MGEYCESGEDVLGNTVWVLRDWGQYHPEPRRPQAERGRVVLPPISKDEDGIPQYVRARLTVFTLLLTKLEPSRYTIGNQVLKVIRKYTKFLHEIILTLIKQ